MRIRFSRFWAIAWKNKGRIAVSLLAALALGVLWVFAGLPSLDSLPGNLNQPSIRITDREGRLLYELIPSEGGRHAVVSLADLPQCLKDATVAVEDKHFYQHPGVDLAGILRALWLNLRGGETIAGGSTITQQAARNLLLDQDERFERSLRRKLREATLAWLLERRYSKDEILALYLNQMYYGGLAYGVEAASQTYFGKSASDLLLPECALLAGLPQAPGLYNPYTNPDLARQRQLVVLGLMQEQGFISAAEGQAAASAPLGLNPAPYPIRAPHFIWIVKDQLDQLFLEGSLDPRQSLVVRTTLDLDAQNVAESVIARRLSKFQAGGLDRNVNNAALVALDPRTGEVLALVGSADYFDASISGAVDMAISPRQTGSAFKPFIYALALDPARPSPWTAATVILDVSTTFTTRDGAPYTPLNYDYREHGPVSVREALGSSLNVPAALALQEVGIEPTLELASRLGMTSLADPQDYDLSLALGGGRASLLELSTAYAAFANQGAYTGYRSLLEVRDADGNLLYTPPGSTPSQVFDPRVAWLVSDILSDDSARVTGFGRDSTLKLERVAAVKTGTTTNFHDNWTIGYTPSLLVGVWVGNSNYEAMRDVTGLTGAAPIWHDTLRALLQGQPDQPFERPADMTRLAVCDLSGLLPTPACQSPQHGEHTRQEWFIPGTEPAQPDNVYVQIWLDPLETLSLVVLDLPPQAGAWARAQGLPLLADYANAPASSGETSLVLASPRPNTVYQIASNIDISTQRLLLEALAGAGVAQVTFWVDGEFLAGASGMPYQAWWPLQVGEHTFWAQGVDASGGQVKSDAVTVTVLAGQ
ncbi:MAG: penicillin-binding protein 1C [Chloroflexota bacterium]